MGFRRVIFRGVTKVRDEWDLPCAALNLRRLREEHARLPTDEAAFGAALHTSGRAVLFVAASIGAGFSVMGFSKFLGMRLFGTLMPIAMAVSCLAALSLMPVLVLRTRPAFVFGRAAKERAGRGRAPRAAAGRRG